MNSPPVVGFHYLILLSSLLKSQLLLVIFCIRHCRRYVYIFCLICCAVFLYYFTCFRVKFLVAKCTYLYFLIFLLTFSFSLGLQCIVFH